jgi:hypothetical protein
MQNYLQLADMRQGTTSVVPKMVSIESGFSRCWMGKQLKTMRHKG